MASPVPNNEATRFVAGEKQVEIARKGAMASAQAKRDRKTFKEELLVLLNQGNTQEKISLAVLKKALNGDIKAFETIRDTVGEKPTDKVEMNANVSYEEAIKKVADNDEY